MSSVRVMLRTYGPMGLLDGSVEVMPCGADGYPGPSVDYALIGPGQESTVTLYRQLRQAPPPGEPRWEYVQRPEPKDWVHPPTGT